MDQQPPAAMHGTVIFYHIPKTAGSSFLSAATTSFPASELYLIDGTQKGNAKSIERFKSLSQHKRDRIKFLVGHNSWGLDCYFSHPCAYIGFLRDPFKRIISEYYHLIRKPAYHEGRKKFKAAGYTLQEYFDKGHLYWGHNLYVKMLIGRRDPDYQVTQEDYNQAVELLDTRFACVGITERFDESLLLFNRVLGWNIARYARRNVADNYSAAELDTVRLSEVCRQLYSYDILLYERVRQRFDEQLNSVSNLQVRLSTLRENVCSYTDSENRRFSVACRRLVKRIVRR